MKIKCITLWNPWASLVAIGAKPHEFRSWSYLERATGVKPGDRVAVASGARTVRLKEVTDLLHRLDDECGSTGLVGAKARIALRRWLDHKSGLDVADPFPLRQIVCTATIGEPKLSIDVMPKWAKFINDSDRLEHAKWAWPMLDVRPTEPIPCKGAQGFFWISVPDEEKR